MNIQDYVQKHTARGECRCWKCADRGNKPDPSGHTIDMMFFTASATNAPTVDDFKKLTTEFVGVHCNCNPFDGREHGYLELGGWIGDQGLALLYMALGTSLGVFNLLTPKTVMPFLGADLAMKMAGAGYVTVKRKEPANDKS